MIKAVAVMAAVLFVSAAHAEDVYRAGVRAYLDGNNEAAIAYLEEAIRQQNSAEKAQQLLSKIHLRTAPSSMPRSRGSVSAPAGGAQPSLARAPAPVPAPRKSAISEKA